MFQHKILGAAALLAMTITPALSLAHGDHEEKEDSHHYEPKPRAPLTAPAAAYSGATAIDRTNGNFFNVGTYGARNPNIEQWAQSSTWAVGMAERPYDFDQKEHFLANLDERIQHFETAVWNYGRVTDISKDEGKAHAAKAAEDLKPRIEKARDAYSKAKSAGRGDWESAQNEAKRTFLELQSFYYSMHKNVH